MQYGIVQDGKILRKKEVEITKEYKDNITQFIEDNIIILINELEESEKLNPEINPLIEKIGIAVPGTVKNNKIVKCVNLGIENYNIAERLKSRLQDKYNPHDLIIQLKNDAKCAAIAEKEYGCLSKYDDAIFLTLGTGIGGALIHDGKLFEPKVASGFEFGHMIIHCNSDKICKCGKKGCFELYASMNAFKNNLKQRLDLSEYTTSKQLYDIIKYDKVLKRNEIKIQECINEFIKNLAIGISNLINIFEPEVIGIGGSFTYFEEFILDDLIKYIKNQNLLFNPRDDIIIKSAILGNDAGIIGASIIS